MGQEVRITDYDVSTANHDGRVTAWEAGLPETADLPPLSQILLSPEMASAFSISPEPHRTMIDVDRASRDTLSSLRGQSESHLMNKMNDFRSVSDDREDEMVVEGEEIVDLVRDGGDSPSRKFRRVDGGCGGGGGEEAESARANKRNRLVWTPQLHKRFVEVVAHLGVKNAVPKTIMQLMNVEGLTRENVASHLQKYRLYLKRMQGLGNEGTSCSDIPFASTPVPKSDLGGSGGGIGNENGQVRVPVPMPYPPQMVPMPYPPPQIVPSAAAAGGGAYHHGFEYHSHHPYNMMVQPKEWSGNNLGPVLPYQHSMTPNHK
ncbi:putative transcription factor MYB-HB-like family [Helianthus annuus]|nr:putative transcription factor MYB-HB-like family [Helianthus annuus]